MTEAPTHAVTAGIVLRREVLECARAEHEARHRQRRLHAITDWGTCTGSKRCCGVISLVSALSSGPLVDDCFPDRCSQCRLMQLHVEPGKQHWNAGLTPHWYKPWEMGFGCADGSSVSMWPCRICAAWSSRSWKPIWLPASLACSACCISAANSAAAKCGPVRLAWQRPHETA